jgi:hypothetical protein
MEEEEAGEEKKELSSQRVLALHGGGDGGAIDDIKRQRMEERREQRKAFSKRLTLAMRAILIVLYPMTGFAKLNDAWHDPAVSCCVQMFIGGLTVIGRVWRILPATSSMPGGTRPLLVPGRHCSPRHSTHFEASFLKIYGIP